MLLSVSYGELEKYLSEKAGKKIRIEYVDAQAVKVSVGVNMLIKEVYVGLTLRVIRFSNAYVLLKYSGKLGSGKVVELILKALAHLNLEVQDCVKVMTDSRILIGLVNIDSLKKILSQITLEKLDFDASGVNMSAALGSVPTAPEMPDAASGAGATASDGEIAEAKTEVGDGQ